MPDVKISDSLFQQVAEAVIPSLRTTLDDLKSETGVDVDANATIFMTATIDINGREERVRIAVTLNPDEEEESSDDEGDDGDDADEWDMDFEEVA